MIEYNILLLNAGRRVELIQCFQKASNRLNNISKIVAADCSETAPALYFAEEKVILPRISDINYIDEIINVCKRERIKLIVPTIDTDLLILAKAKNRIQSETGALILISDIGTVVTCRDKIKTQKFLERFGFSFPEIYSDEEIESKLLKFPLFIKPKSGSSSINTFKINSLEELKTYKLLVKEPIIQDFIDGDEFTVDVFLDFDGNLVTVVPRLRISTRGGEILKGKIIKDKEIIEDIKRLVKVLKFIGHITIQLIKTEEGIIYLEINPRFGGGAPMSIQSGADSCENLYRLLMGEKLKYNENYRDNITFLRFDNSICLDENMEIVQW